MSAIFRHELRNYFHSLTAYVFGAFLLAVVGLGSMLYNLQAAVSNFEFVLSFASIIFVVIVPVLTMRTMAEERRQRTDQLLYSLPITTTQVVLGKYLALLVVYLIPLAIISLYPLLFSQFGDVYLPTSYGSLLAFFLMGAALLAVGMFVSSLTENQGFAAGIGIYWVVQSGEEDDVIENLLSKYESLSGHIEVIKKNPDVYPTFTQQYTSENVPNNSLIVESGDRNRYISYNDIYIQNADMYSYSYSTSFDGDGAITSAIDYVVNSEQPKLYLIEGHGEADLPSTFQNQVEKDNIEIESLSLLNTETIPDDADCLMIYAPESDLSEDEQNLLADYVAGGGKLLVVAGPTRENGILENLYSLLSDYGVEPVEGIVVESDPTYYSAFSGPAAILPELHSNDITDSLIDANYSVLMPIALGLTVEDSYSGAVTELLTTSDTSFSKAAGYAMETYDYEEGDIDGPFATGVSVETDGGGEMVWFTSSYFLEDSYNASSSGANGDLAMNALADMIGESEANLVFTDEIGTHLAIHTFYKYFKKIAASIGRPDARVHDLRHTAATVMIASGADIKSVQDFMGHATASFTLNVYAHTSEQMMKDTAARTQSYYDKLRKA